jgi:hypothetical protein
MNLGPIICFVLFALCACGPSLSTRLRIATEHYADHFEQVQVRTGLLEQRFSTFRYRLSDEQATRLRRATELQNETSWRAFFDSLSQAQLMELKSCVAEARYLENDSAELRREAEAVVALEEKRREQEQALAIALGILQQQQQQSLQQQQALTQQRQQQAVIDSLHRIDIQLQQVTHPGVLVIPR